MIPPPSKYFPKAWEMGGQCSREQRQPQQAGARRDFGLVETSHNRRLKGWNLANKPHRVEQGGFFLKHNPCTLLVTNRGQSLLIKTGSSSQSKSFLRTGLRGPGDRQYFIEIGGRF